GDPHPVGALVGLHVEDLLVERGRVVDHDDDLRLGVEVGPRLHQQLLDLVEILLGAGHQNDPTRSASWRSVSASTSSGSRPWPSRRSLRAITSWRTSARSSWSWRSPAAGPSSDSVSRRSVSVSTSIGASPRRSWRSCFAISIWRTSAAWIAGSTAVVGRAIP